jgi:succinyl-CoA synthetase beta subunit
MLAKSPQEVYDVADTFGRFDSYCDSVVLTFLFQGQYRLVLKAQVLAGGRGKGKFDNGFHGGVHYVERSTPISSGLCFYSTYTAC